MTSKVGHKFFGKTSVVIPQPQRESWDSHAAEKTWSDAGEVRKVLETIAPVIEQLVSKNATLGASEYLASSEVAMRAHDKDVLLGIRIWNEEVQMIGEVSLRNLLLTALQQARASLGVDPQAQALVAALMQIGRELASIVSAHNGPQTPTPRIARSPQ